MGSNRLPALLTKAKLELQGPPHVSPRIGFRAGRLPPRALETHQPCAP